MSYSKDSHGLFQAWNLGKGDLALTPHVGWSLHLFVLLLSKFRLDVLIALRSEQNKKVSSAFERVLGPQNLSLSTGFLDSLRLRHR